MTDQPVSDRPTVSELRKAHDAALTEWKTGGHGDRGYFKALDIAKILADRLEEAERRFLRMEQSISMTLTDAGISDKDIGDGVKVLVAARAKAEREANVCHEAHGELLADLQKAEREVERLRTIVNAAFGPVPGGPQHWTWKETVDHAEAALREGSK